jgi:hypothetical protein
MIDEERSQNYQLVFLGTYFSFINSKCVENVRFIFSEKQLIPSVLFLFIDAYIPSVHIDAGKNVFHVKKSVRNQIAKKSVQITVNTKNQIKDVLQNSHVAMNVDIYITSQLTQQNQKSYFTVRLLKFHIDNDIQSHFV